jgi:valyl-tRNA synthetase
VTRRFGWDCHGLPVEYEIDKKLNIKSRQDVFDMGIGAYNEECRSIVMRYSKEWETIVKRIGRWIDFEVRKKVFFFFTAPPAAFLIFLQHQSSYSSFFINYCAE